MIEIDLFEFGDFLRGRRRTTDLCCCCCVILDKDEGDIATIVVRGSTENIMDDVERAIDDGINTFKTLTKVRV